MNTNKALSLIGLARRAGKTVSGEFSTEKAVKSGKAYVVILAADASDNTKKKFRNMCEYYEVPCYELCDKVLLGKAMGQEYRACMAIRDYNFAEALIKKIEE